MNKNPFEGGMNSDVSSDAGNIRKIEKCRQVDLAADKMPVLEKAERWKAPGFEELRERKNGFRENRADIHGFMKLVLLERVQNGSVSPYEAKSFFQSLELSDHGTFLYEDDVEAYKKRMYARPQLEQISSEEIARGRVAFEALKKLPLSKATDVDGNGFYKTPKYSTSNSGVFLTNIFRNAENINGKSMQVEGQDFRVNIACAYDTANLRILLDLFELLRSNETLAEKGFKIKSLGNNRTDSIIVYCGECGTSAALEEAVNYCIREGLDLSEQGVPLGVKPLDKHGIPMRRISVTSSPHGGFTFNDLQSTALLEAFKVVAGRFVKKNFGGQYDFDNAKPDNLLKLLPEIKNRDTYLIPEMEKEYEIVLRKLCQADSVNMHNLAFPFVK